LGEVLSVFASDQNKNALKINEFHLEIIFDLKLSRLVLVINEKFRHLAFDILKVNRGDLSGIN